MNELLRQLYLGKIRPAEQYEFLLEEYNLKRSCVIKDERKFYEMLSDKQKVEFIRILDEHTDLLPEEVESIYIQGMRMGAQLMQELLIKERQK